MTTERLVPLSAEAVHNGFETFFPDDGGPEAAMAKFKNNRNVYTFIHGLVVRLGVLNAAPENEVAPVFEAIPVNETMALGGAALYYTCIKEEAKLKKLSLPKVTLADHDFWIRQLEPSESVHIRPGSHDYNELFMRKWLDESVERARNFDMTDINFSTMVLDYFATERGYTNQHRFNTLFGAAEAFALFSAYYDRRDLQAAIR